MSDEAQWVVWNGSLGILDMATIGHVETNADGRRAYLAPPYGAVGPFSLDELEASGRILFGACMVMSRLRWQEDQVDLRLEAQRSRRAFLFQPDDEEDDRAHREALDLPLEGILDTAQINSAFRRLAKTAHPDGGGSDAHYRRIAEAREALLALVVSAV